MINLYQLLEEARELGAILSKNQNSFIKESDQTIPFAVQEAIESVFKKSLPPRSFDIEALKIYVHQNAFSPTDLEDLYLRGFFDILFGQIYFAFPKYRDNANYKKHITQPQSKLLDFLIDRFGSPWLTLRLRIPREFIPDAIHPRNWTFERDCPLSEGEDYFYLESDSSIVRDLAPRLAARLWEEISHAPEKRSSVEMFKTWWEKVRSLSEFYGVTSEMGLQGVEGLLNAISQGLLEEDGLQGISRELRRATFYLEKSAQEEVINNSKIPDGNSVQETWHWLKHSGPYFNIDYHDTRDDIATLAALIFDNFSGLPQWIFEFSSGLLTRPYLLNVFHDRMNFRVDRVPYLLGIPELSSAAMTLLIRTVINQYQSKHEPSDALLKSTMGNVEQAIDLQISFMKSPYFAQRESSWIEIIFSLSELLIEFDLRNNIRHPKDAMTLMDAVITRLVRRSPVDNEQQFDKALSDRVEYLLTKRVERRELFSHAVVMVGLRFLDSSNRFERRDIFKHLRSILLSISQYTSQSKFWPFQSGLTLRYFPAKILGEANDEEIIYLVEKLAPTCIPKVERNVKGRRLFDLGLEAKEVEQYRLFAEEVSYKLQLKIAIYLAVANARSISTVTSEINEQIRGNMFYDADVPSVNLFDSDLDRVGVSEYQTPFRKTLVEYLAHAHTSSTKILLEQLKSQLTLNDRLYMAYELTSRGREGILNGAPATAEVMTFVDQLSWIPNLQEAIEVAFNLRYYQAVEALLNAFEKYSFKSADLRAFYLKYQAYLEATKGNAKIVKQLDEALRDLPKPDLYITQGNALFESDPKEARAYYHKALALRPNDLNLLGNMIGVQVNITNLESNTQELENLRKFIELFKNSLQITQYRISELPWQSVCNLLEGYVLLKDYDSIKGLVESLPKDTKFHPKIVKAVLGAQ